ncbi:MAG: hypothetical protein OEZ31_01570 [Nitrospirota bacterium]|nr:hypothetical protein [Nitrospirota bacterium]MDH5767634.1 hypothetical protein [Nitrospirota bacterium]
MFKRLKESFDSGLDKIKWFSSLFSDRMKIEYSVMKLLYQSDQMEKKKEDLMKTIGKRVFELKGYSILKDDSIVEALRELEKINSEIEEIKKKASEMSKVET